MDYCTVIKNDVGIIRSSVLSFFYGGEDLTQAFPRARSCTVYHGGSQPSVSPVAGDLISSSDL